MTAIKNVTVSFGKPITTPVLVPVEHKSTPECINVPFMVNGECYKVTAMSFSTPHGAVIVDDVDSIDITSIGRSLGTHQLFPKGASIVFIQLLGENRIKARLWQRDNGETAFTPEAVCVAATAVMLLQRIPSNKIDVFMGGNNFGVKWDRDMNCVSLTGDSKLL